MSAWAYDEYGWYANDSYLGQHYIRLNDSNEWVYQVNPLLEKGAPLLSGVHDHVLHQVKCRVLAQLPAVIKCSPATAMVNIS